MNYIWVINNLIACQSATYIRDLTVLSIATKPNKARSTGGSCSTYTKVYIRIRHRYRHVLHIHNVIMYECVPSSPRRQRGLVIYRSSLRRPNLGGAASINLCWLRDRLWLSDLGWPLRQNGLHTFGWKNKLTYTCTESIQMLYGTKYTEHNVDWKHPLPMVRIKCISVICVWETIEKIISNGNRSIFYKWFVTSFQTKYWNLNTYSSYPINVLIFLW